MSERRRIHWFTYLFLLPVAAFTLLPIVYMTSTSFKPLDELFLYPPRFFVHHPVLDNFEGLLIPYSVTDVPFVRYIFNTIFVTGGTVLGSVAISSLAAYPLAKHRMPGRNLIFTAVIAALMFAPEVTQIPRYLVVHWLGFIDTYAGLIVPNLAAAYGLFLMKQFMEQVPDQLIESAKVDGSSEWTTFWRIVMPMCQPAWVTLLIFSFIATWNDYFTPLVFTRSDTMRTLTLAIQLISGGATVVARQGVVAAASFLATAPTIVVFCLLQRRVIQTMAYSGIKG